MVYTITLTAQPSDSGDEFDGMDPDPTPIDNGFTLLIMAGVIVGIFFLLQQKKYRTAFQNNNQ